jgi:hypothetical protein
VCQFRGQPLSICTLIKKGRGFWKKREAGLLPSGRAPPAQWAVSEGPLGTAQCISTLKITKPVRRTYIILRF